METPLLDWNTIGDAANVLQLTGVNVIGLIALIVKAASDAKILSEECREFAEYLKCNSDLLEAIQMTEVMECQETRAPLKKLENVLRKSYDLVESCKKRRYLIVACSMRKKLEQARKEVVNWLLIIPLISLVQNQRFNKAATKSSDQIGVDSGIKLSDMVKPYLKSSEDTDIHSIFIEAAAKNGEFEVLERVTRESNYYDAEKTKNFLMKARLQDARPLINVCHRFGYVPDLIHYLCSNKMLRGIEHYVQKVNPSNAPLVVGQLLDYDCPKDFIEGLILSVRSLVHVEPLVEECEKRNELRLLTQFLEHLVMEGSQNVHVHNALGKIIIDTNSNRKHFLTTNSYYDSRVVGKYCEKRDPTLAVVEYVRGQCEDELIDVARYVVKRMEPELWEKVLNLENPFRRQLIDQVVSTALPESKDPDQVSATLRAFMTANLQHELIELLEKILLQNSAFSENPNLQELLIITAIKADKSRVMDYINRLDKFDGPAIIEIAVKEELYEEAFAIAQKLN